MMNESQRLVYDLCCLVIGRNSIGCNSIMIEEPYSLSPMDDGHDECLVSLDGLFESERRNSVLSNEVKIE